MPSRVSTSLLSIYKMFRVACVVGRDQILEGHLKRFIAAEGSSDEVIPWWTDDAVESSGPFITVDARRWQKIRSREDR